MSCVPGAPWPEPHTPPPKQPRLKIQAGEQTLGAMHTGTWPSPAQPHAGSCPCPIPPCSRAPSACCVPQRVSRPPLGCSNAPRTRGTQGADDRSCPLLKKAKQTDCTSSDPSYTSPDPTQTPRVPRAPLYETTRALGTQPHWLALTERLLWTRCYMGSWLPSPNPPLTP